MPDDDERLPLIPSGPPLGSDREIQFRKRRGVLRRHRAALVALAAVVVVLGVGLGAVVATWNYGDSSQAELAASVDASDSAVPTSPEASSPAARTAPTTPAAGTGASTTARGTIASLAADTWTMKTSTGLVYTVVITADTKFRNPAVTGKVKVTDFKLGDKISVTGTLASAVLTAASIKLNS